MFELQFLSEVYQNKFDGIINDDGRYSAFVFLLYLPPYSINKNFTSQ